jgi:hypothetical protein
LTNLPSISTMQPIMKLTTTLHHHFRQPLPDRSAG